MTNYYNIFKLFQPIPLELFVFHQSTPVFVGGMQARNYEGLLGV